MKIVTTEAIRRPDVAFNLIHGERKLIDAPASDLKTRIGVLLGRDAAKELIEISGEAEDLRLEGFLTRPAVSRKSTAGGYIFMLMEGLFKLRNTCYSIRGAYGSLLHDGHFPNRCIIPRNTSKRCRCKRTSCKKKKKKNLLGLEEEKKNKSLREIIKDVLSDQALISHINLEKGETKTIFGTPSPAGSSSKKAKPLTTIDSLQQEFDVTLNQDEIETNMPSMRPLALIENKYIVAMGLDGLLHYRFSCSP